MGPKNIKKNIKEYGWQFELVFDLFGVKRDFSYSIGFEESFGHPEIMIFGLQRDIMYTVMSDIADDLKKGRVFKPNTKIKNVLLGDYDVMFKPVDVTFNSNYADLATAYYKKPFRLYVMFWPDNNNILPTEANCTLTVQNEALELV